MKLALLAFETDAGQRRRRITSRSIVKVQSRVFSFIGIAQSPTAKDLQLLSAHTINDSKQTQKLQEIHIDCVD